MKLLLENWRQYLKEGDIPYQIYCDMDGVLVSFEPAVVEYINKKLQNGDAEELKANIDRDYVIEDDIDMSNPNKLVRDYMRAEISNRADFWGNLEWADGGQKLWNYLIPYKPYILTTPMGYGSEIGKQEWIDNNLRPLPKKIFMERDKYHWAVINGKPNILIDDWEKNTTSWQNAGGIAILHVDTDQTIQRLEEILNEAST